MKQIIVLAGFLLFCNALRAQTQYDLLLKGGHVIDPKNGTNEPMDVAISDGMIARIAAGIPAAEGKKVVEVSGLYVPFFGEITMPPWGVTAPPLRLVPAPRATTGTFLLSASFTSATTCSVLIGNTTASGCRSTDSPSYS